MNDPIAIYQKKLRLLGNILLFVACLELIQVVFWTVYATSAYIKLHELSLVDIYPEIILLLFGSILPMGLLIVTSVVILRLALAWRRADAFGRTTIIGMRCLGVLWTVQSVAGWISHIYIDIDDIHGGPVEIPSMLLVGGPDLSMGILFIILSWALEYGRRIKDEQALTI